MLAAGKDGALLRYSLGNEYLKANDPARAAEHLARAVAQDPKYTAAWKLYGKALRAAGRAADALAAWREGIAVAHRARRQAGRKGNDRVRAADRAVKDLTHGSIYRHLLAMAAPIAAGMLLQTLYYIVDLYFVAQLGDAALAGVGAAGTAMFAVFALTQMLGVGTVALMSHAVGRKDRADASHIFNQSVALSTLWPPRHAAHGGCGCRVPAVWLASTCRDRARRHLASLRSRRCAVAGDRQPARAAHRASCSDDDRQREIPDRPRLVMAAGGAPRRKDGGACLTATVARPQP